MRLRNLRKERFQVRLKTRKTIQNLNFLAIICTDVVARGLDLDCCNTVINYDVALSAATHVHRSGRTARAGSAGVCITLCQLKHKPYFFMMKELGRKYIQRSIKDLEIKTESRKNQEIMEE